MGEVIPFLKPEAKEAKEPDPFLDALRAAAIARHRIVWIVFEGAAENAGPAHMAFIKRVFGY